MRPPCNFLASCATSPHSSHALNALALPLLWSCLLRVSSAEVKFYRLISAVSEWERSGVVGRAEGGWREERGVQMKRNKQMTGHTAGGRCTRCAATRARPAVSK